jgi:serine O-acetyltransferase
MGRADGIQVHAVFSRRKVGLKGCSVHGPSSHQTLHCPLSLKCPAPNARQATIVDWQVVAWLGAICRRARATKGGASSVFENVLADLRRYTGGTLIDPIAVANGVMSYGFLATVVYRYARWTRTIKPKILSYPFKLIYRVLQLFVDMFFGIFISPNHDIGPGLYIGHFGAIFIVGDLGANCSVGQGVTIGFKGAGKSTRSPRIGHNVYIGTGAFVVGDITVGDNVIIGANTTVVKNVPADHTIVSAAPRLFPNQKA